MPEPAIELLGFIAATVSVFVYISNTMIPLRIAAVVANALFAGYFYLRGIYPQCALNLVLLPLNGYRLQQMRNLVRAVKTSSRDDFDFAWLRPFMKPRKMTKGQFLYAAGEEAKEAFVIVKGAVLVPEKDVTLREGALFGELGLFAEDNKRTASVTIVEDTDLLVISYTDVLQLCAQNPTFGFYLMRLIMRRMQHNTELAEQAALRKPRDPPVIATS
jgi:CRP/FNR family transcriptional regulator, cyclic AMP receptor protein